ncbi:MAG: molybdenum cofactor guanylyltransferase [Acidobacteriaceae bacterium]
MTLRTAASAGGFVLAGGRSSRMGCDKALLEFAGKPLVQRAVGKLQHLCAEVWILGDRPDLASYAPCIPDAHPGCGPLGGLESALMQTPYDWNLFLSVDVPLVPVAWLAAMLQLALHSTAVAVVTVEDGREHPLCALYHRDLLPFLQQGIAEGDYKVMRVLHHAVSQLAEKRGCKASDLLLRCGTDSFPAQLQALPQKQRAAQPLWFANLNTPQDVMAALSHADALDEV